MTDKDITFETLVREVLDEYGDTGRVADIITKAIDNVIIRKLLEEFQSQDAEGKEKLVEIIVDEIEHRKGIKKGDLGIIISRDKRDIK